MKMTNELYKLMDEVANSNSTESKALILDKIESLNLKQKDVARLLDYARQPPPSAAKSKAFLEILDRIGFPKNKAGLTYIVSEASDINSANWELARSILIQLGMNAISEIRNALKIYGQDYDEYNLYIQGLCQLLEDMHPSISKHAIPELLILVEKGTDMNYVDEFALWPIKTIGSPDADSVIPKLVDKILAKNRSVRIKGKCIEALKHFDPETVRQYAQHFRSKVSDSNEAIGIIEELLDWANNKTSG